MTKTYKVVGMHCTACATSIELDLEEMGIQASCSYVKQTLEVEEGADKKVLEKVIQPHGYDLE